jgi:hypothetical protein
MMKYLKYLRRIPGALWIAFFTFLAVLTEADED